MPITPLEMVSFTFRSRVKRDRNAGGTGAKSEREKVAEIGSQKSESEDRMLTADCRPPAAQLKYLCDLLYTLTDLNASYALPHSVGVRFRH